jgi:hypothetical protein
LPFKHYILLLKTKTPAGLGFAVKLASLAPDVPHEADDNPKAASGRGDVQSRMI